MAIQSLEEMQAYLREKGVQFTGLQELTGGTANYVFRLTNPSGETCILKHAEPFVRSFSSMPFSVERMNFEATALQTVNSRLSQEDPTIHIAQFVDYDEDQHVLTMSDGGSRDLKTAYTDPSVDVMNLGRKIGRWLADLHSATKSARMGENTVAKIYRHSYLNLANALEEYGFDKQLGVRVNEEFGSLLATDDECICHGDFWPGNLLLSANQNLTIVDWEMMRRGTGATDVAQFAAESWLLDRCRGQRGMLPAFLEGYSEIANNRASLSVEWKKRFVIHCGTHLAFWPTRVEWATRKETHNIVEYGRELISRALDENWAWLKKSDLGKIL